MELLPHGFFMGGARLDTSANQMQKKILQFFDMCKGGAIKKHTADMFQGLGPEWGVTHPPRDTKERGREIMNECLVPILTLGSIGPSAHKCYVG